MSVAWILLLTLAGLVVCGAVRFLTAPGARTLADRVKHACVIGWGTCLIPVAATCVAVFGAYSLAYEPGRANVFSAVTVPGSLWWSLVTMAGVAAFTAVAQRQAAYLAAVGLIALGLYELYVAVIFPPVIYGQEWYGWSRDAISRPLLVALSLASVAGGSALARRTIVTDLRARDTVTRSLTARVQGLVWSRAEALDAATAELRRIERDLHDGAQARLVALGINLRVAQKLVATSPDAAQALIGECQETSSQALADLRDLVRGIYPPVLADRGIADAVAALALDCPIPVVTDITLAGRPPAPVESAVYFAIAEILNNVVRHARADVAHVRMEYRAGLLRVQVADDGVGGVDPQAGTGLLGLERRLGVFDGILAVSSPAGGPTVVIIEVPCALSSPKTSIS